MSVRTEQPSEFQRQTQAVADRHGIDAEKTESSTEDAGFGERLKIMAEARLIGGAMIVLSLIAIVLNRILSLDSFNLSSGPFSGFIDTLSGTGQSAMGLLVVGLIVLAANAILNQFGSGF
jgi:hypothetical protein